MKKILNLLLAAVACLGLAACSGDGRSVGDDVLQTYESEPQETVTSEDVTTEAAIPEDVIPETAIPENAIPDILSWGGDAVAKHRSTLYEIYIADAEVINDYVALLQECGFVLADHWKSPSDDREEWGFVKEEYPDLKKYGAKWLDDSYHLSFYHPEDSLNEYWFVYDEDTFVLYDFGIRRDGSNAEPGAVIVTEEEKEGTTDVALALSVGETTGVSYTWTQFGSAYHTYDWEVVSGSGHIEIESVTGDTCKIKAISEGTAVLRVRYHYTTDGEDAFTGKPRKELKVKEKEYKVVVE